MNDNGRDATTPAAAEHDESRSDNHEQERSTEQERPIVAAQRAAPSTRRWRRAERTKRSR